MSITPTPPPPPTTPAETTDVKRELKIVSHSGLFYWWPVWAMGFLLALITWFEDTHAVFVPDGATLTRTTADGKTVEGLTLPPDVRFPVRDPNNPDVPAEAKLYISKNKVLGVIFATVLLLVIVITNVPLRGMWSVIVILTIIFLVVLFTALGLWESIVETLGLLRIHINMASYLTISLFLFAAWLVTFLFFDQQIYMVFSPGSFKVKMEIGGAEESFDTMQLKLTKQRSDLFRHWILGLGSGDLIVNTAGAHPQHFELPNVLFVGQKLQQIEELIREKEVV